jgi:hypothetical protein
MHNSLLRPPHFQEHRWLRLRGSRLYFDNYQVVPEQGRPVVHSIKSQPHLLDEGTFYELISSLYELISSLYELISSLYETFYEQLNALLCEQLNALLCEQLNASLYGVISSLYEQLNALLCEHLNALLCEQLNALNASLYELKAYWTYYVSV